MPVVKHELSFGILARDLPARLEDLRRALTAAWGRKVEKREMARMAGVRPHQYTTWLRAGARPGELRLLALAEEAGIPARAFAEGAPMPSKYVSSAPDDQTTAGRHVREAQARYEPQRPRGKGKDRTGIDDGGMTLGRQLTDLLKRGGSDMIASELAAAAKEAVAAGASSCEIAKFLKGVVFRFQRRGWPAVGIARLVDELDGEDGPGAAGQ